MSDERDLLDAWARGDRRAAEQLFERHLVSLVRFFRNKVDMGADDLVQETFVAAMRSRDRFRHEGTFRGFLLGCAHNVLLMHLRKIHRRGLHLDPEIECIDDGGASPSTVAAQREEHRLLLNALRRIPIDHQVALELYHWEGLSGSELAATLGLTEAAVRSRLHRAKLDLRTQLERLAVDPALVESTMANLDDWARQIRAGLVAPA